MQRNYLSGARKRKLAKDKKSKESAALLKVPKIDGLFSLSATPSTSHGTSNDNVIDEEPTTGSEIELHSSHTDAQIGIAETDGNVDFDNVSEPEDVSAASTSTTFESESTVFEQFPTDVGLWNIETKIISLQKYWLEKGR